MAANSEPTSPAARSPRAFRRPTMFAFAVLALGLLLWARFLLVTGHPRTAIAEPPAQPQVTAAHP